MVVAVLGVTFFPINHWAQAASQVWNGNSTVDGNWTTTTNWVNNAYPGGLGATNSGSIATFNAAIAHTWGNSASNPVVINNVAGISIAGLTFDTAAGNYFIGSTNGNSLLLTSGGTIQILSSLTATNATETINAPLVIEGANYTFANNSANGTGAGAGTLNIGGQVSSGVSGAIVLALSGTNTNANTIRGNIINGSATTLAITKSGTGTWTLSGANSYTGTTTLNSGTLNLNSSGAVGTGQFAINGGTIDNTSGTAITGQTNNSTIALSNNFTFGGSNSLSLGVGAVSANADITITLSGNNANTLTFGGTLTNMRTNVGIGIIANNATGVSGESVIFNNGINLNNNTAAGALNTNIGGSGNIIVNGVIANGNTFANTLTKQGTGTVILTGANTYTGTTSIDATGGRLQLGNGGTTGSLSTSSNITDNGNLTINRSNAVTQGTDFGTITGGSGSFTQAGSGTTTLTAANSYTGATAVNRGTLDLGGSTASGSINSGSALVMGGGTLTYTRTGGTNQTFNGTTFNSGASTITVAAGDTLALGAITRNTGGTAYLNTTGTITTTTNNRDGFTNKANTNGFLGAYAVYGSYDWASNSGGTITYFSGYTTYDNVASFPNGVDLTDTYNNGHDGYDGSATNSVTINSLRFNTGSATGGQQH